VRRELGETTEGLEALLAEFATGAAARALGAAATTTGAASRAAVAKAVPVTVKEVTARTTTAASEDVRAASTGGVSTGVASPVGARVSVVIRRPRRTPTPVSFPSRDSIEEEEEEEPLELTARKRRRVEEVRSTDESGTDEGELAGKW
jgi:hypothetical protein